jgi:hypothetical protein
MFYESFRPPKLHSFCHAAIGMQTTAKAMPRLSSCRAKAHVGVAMQALRPRMCPCEVLVTLHLWSQQYHGSGCSESDFRCFPKAASPHCIACPCQCNMTSARTF